MQERKLINRTKAIRLLSPPLVEHSPVTCFCKAVSAYRTHKKIGQNIRKLRLKAGLTQEKLAEKANLHPVYISQVERAERAITIDSLLKITKALGIRLRHVIGDL